MTTPTPTANPRIAKVATYLLDTRVGSDTAPPTRDLYRRIALPIPATARVIAARLAEAVGDEITGDEIRNAAALLKSRLRTDEIRDLAAAARRATIIADPADVAHVATYVNRLAAGGLDALTGAGRRVQAGFATALTDDELDRSIGAQIDRAAAVIAEAAYLTALLRARRDPAASVNDDAPLYA